MIDNPISHYDTDLSSRLAVTELLNAVVEGNRTKVQEFLTKGFPVNYELNDSGWRLLHVAAQAGETAIVSTLLAKGADIDQTDSEEHATALMIAVVNNQPDVALPSLKLALTRVSLTSLGEVQLK
jgi:ankyrin repeat protein